MPRRARKKSISGYFHVIVRGVGKQILFECNGDYSFFISLLRKYSKETEVKICAYCLMENHVHMIVCDDNGALPLFMKKIGICYAGYYNKKYERSGHLFQDRYMSEPIETKEYLLTVFRYVLNNPKSAGICPASEYRWSSYHKYGDIETFVDTEVFYKWIGGWEKYASYINENNSDQCMEYYSPNSDEWAKDVLTTKLGVRSGTVLKEYTKDERDDALRTLKMEGLTIRQIERLTGIGRGIIQRV